MAGNKSLTAAAKAKQDEFYTQLTDIEKEMRYYRKHFKDKTVLCNCDDPFESNFFKYFALNFNRLGLKKLIATCYYSSPIAGQQLQYGCDANGQMTFYFEDKGVEENKSKRPYKAVVTQVYDKMGDGGVDMLDVAELFRSGENELVELEGNGDFRSPECLALLGEADIVVTNPPFSLFRDYMNCLIEHNKHFVIIGNQNAIHYKEIFPLLQNGQVWLGYNHVKDFMKPDGTMQKFGNILWFTNLDIKKRHEDLILVQRFDPDSYPVYINYNAIDVNRISEIPCDYAGHMGVPDNFLETYNPEQFEIIGLAESSLGREIGFSANLTEEECNDLFRENKSFRRGNPIFRGNDGKLHKPFSRIIIRNKRPEPSKEVK